MIRDLAEIAWDSILSLQGEYIEVVPVRGAVFTRLAVFEKTSIQVDGNTGMIVRTPNPSIGVFYKEDDQVIVGGDRFKIRGAFYRAEEIVPDGQGGARIELHKIKEL